MSPNFEPQRIATTQARHRNIDEVENVLDGMRSSHAAGDDFAVEEMLLALNKSGHNPYREEIVESVAVIAWDRFPARDEEKVGKRGRLVLTKMTTADNHFFRRVYLYHEGSIRRSQHSDHYQDHATNERMYCCWGWLDCCVGQPRQTASQQRAAFAYNANMTSPVQVPRNT